MSGPSGTIQPPAEIVKKNDRLSANAAQTPARALNSRRVSRYRSQVEPANKNMNGNLSA